MSKGNGLLDSDIEIILSKLKKFHDIEEVLLYWSRAKWNYKKGSDIDLAIKWKWVNFDTCSSLHFELEEDTYLPYFFDITNYETLTNKNLKDHIDRIGEVIYRKEENS